RTQCSDQRRQRPSDGESRAERRADPHHQVTTSWGGAGRPPTVGGLLGGAAKQSVNGNVPFASGHASTQQADAKAGVFSGK
ncbi:hypothetical protein I5Q39_23070, partial [Serratia marcescens]|nr:hypothetical protein [Serratia marcescens]